MVEFLYESSLCRVGILGTSMEGVSKGAAFSQQRHACEVRDQTMLSWDTMVEITYPVGYRSPLQRLEEPGVLSLLLVVPDHELSSYLGKRISVKFRGRFFGCHPLGQVPGALRRLVG